LPQLPPGTYAAEVLKLPPFDYLAPGSLADRQNEARVLAGGQSLIPLLALRLARPDCLVSLGRIGELRGISEEGGAVSVGSMTSELTLERSPLIAERLPLLRAALSFIGHPAIRSRGTLGGSLAHCDPAAELPAVALVLGAQMVAQSRDRGPRTMTAADFFLGPFTTSLHGDEILTEIRFMPWPSATGYGFDEVARRSGDFAMVGVAAAAQVEGDALHSCRIALTGVSDRALLRTEEDLGLVGAAPGDFAAAAGRLAEELTPPAALHGSSDYRRQLVRTLVPRVLASAWEMAVSRPGSTAGPYPSRAMS
jgi:carbon-monoxide dehydrogenase medium subunit